MTENLTLQFMPPPNGNDVPYTRPLQWLDWEHRFQVARPYSTPQDEFIRNRWRPTQSQLAFRWKGMAEERDVPLIYLDSRFEVERNKHQDMVRRELDISYSLDPDYILRENYHDIQRLEAKIQDIDSQLESGVVRVVESVGSPETGYERIERWRPMSQATYARYTMLIAQLTKLKAVLQGRATEISVQKHEVTGTLKDLIDRSLRDHNHRDRDGYSFDDLQSRANKAIPAGSSQAFEVANSRNDLELAPASLGARSRDGADYQGATYEQALEIPES